MRSWLKSLQAFWSALLLPIGPAPSLSKRDINRNAFILLLVAFATSLATNAPAESLDPGTLDISFNAGTPIPSGRRILVLADDSFLVLGAAEKGLLKYQKNGRADNLFNLRIPTGIKLVAANNVAQLLAILQTDPSTERLVRLNPNGTRDDLFIDYSFNAQSFWALALAVQPDGRIVIGGIAFDGTVIRRFEESGQPDSAFAVKGSNSSIPPSVNVLCIQSNGQIIVAGNFATIQGVMRNNIARLNSDGTVDTSYDPGATLSGPGSVGRVAFYDAALDTADNLYITGSFTNVENQPRDQIARFLPSGALDKAFSPTLGRTAFNSLWPFNDLGLASANAVFLATTFRSFRITNGVVDASFGRMITADSIREASDRSIYLSTTTIDRTNVVPRICRFTPELIWDKSFNPPGPNGAIRKIRALPSGEVLIGGDFGPIPYFWDFPNSGLAMLHRDGTLNTNFNVAFFQVLDFDVDTNGYAFVVAKDTSSPSEYPYLGRVNLAAPAEVITFHPKKLDFDTPTSVLVLRSGKVLFSGVGESSRFNADLTPDLTWKGNLLSVGRMVEAPDRSIYACWNVPYYVSSSALIYHFMEDGKFPRNISIRWIPPALLLLFSMAGRALGRRATQFTRSR